MTEHQSNRFIGIIEIELLSYYVVQICIRIVLGSSTQVLQLYAGVLQRIGAQLYPASSTDCITFKYLFNDNIVYRHVEAG